MDRRGFLMLLSSCSTAAFIEHMEFILAVAQQGTTEIQFPVSHQAADLYSRTVVIDGNAVLPFDKPVSKDPLPMSQAALTVTRDSGVTAIKLTLAGGAGKGFEDAVHDAAFIQRVIETYPESFLQARSTADFMRAKAERKLGILFSFENPDPLGTDLKRIALFRNLGIRVMQITYNTQSPFGTGCLAGETGGLTELGRQAIGTMNQIGVALDLSHSNTQTTSEAIAVSSKPPIFSHTGCRGVYVHPRNKEDRDLRALANKGGVVGIYMLPFLTEPSKQPMVADYMAHMTHALGICGEDHVAVGSDLFMRPFELTPEKLDWWKKFVEERKKAGISAPGEERPPYIPDMNTPRKMEVIADALLKRGYSTTIAEKVLGANWMRVFREIWD